jgi:hypothetical protein
MMRPGLLLLGGAWFAAASSGCAFEKGRGFGTIEQATLSARLEPGSSRALGDDTVLTDLGYAVRLEQARIRVDRVSLQELPGGGGEGVGFDPADPPPGYTLCHGGHCHHEDGRLVDYQEIEAELAAAGDAEFVSIVVMPGPESIDLWSDDPVELTSFVPSRELARATLSRLEVSLGQLTLRGALSGGPTDSGFGDPPAPLEVDFPLGTVLGQSIHFVIGEEEPGEFRLWIDLVAHGTLFDQIDFASHGSDGEVTVGDPQSTLALELSAAWGGSALHVEFD